MNLVLIPGWGASAEMWQDLAARLPDLAVQRPGWSDCLRDWPATIAAALPAEPCIIGGWSLGAMLALRAAIEMPRRVRGLVLVSGTARFTADHDHAGAEAGAVRAMRRGLRPDPSRVLRDFARQALRPEIDGEFESRFLAQAEHHTTDDLAAGLDCLGSLDLRDGLERLAVPALLLHGAADTIVPLEAGRHLASRLPAARLHVLPGRGHALPFTAGDQIARLIESFAHEHISGR